MLLLQRRVGESIYIGDDIKLTVLDASHREIRIGIQAPREIAVHREEIYQRIQIEKAGGKLPPVEQKNQSNSHDTQLNYDVTNSAPTQWSTDNGNKSHANAAEYPRITNKKDVFKNRSSHPFRRSSRLKRDGN